MPATVPLPASPARTPPAVVRVDLDEPVHRRELLRVLESYARDPMGMERELEPGEGERILDGLREHPTSFVILALIDGEGAGAVVCFTAFSTFQAKPFLTVLDLTVRRRHRRKGLARLLLRACEEEARRLGCGKLTLEVREDNQGALALYRELGFGDPVLGRQPQRTLVLEKPLATDNRPTNQRPPEELA
ncbi:MAG TPA: GNAT family N-acetyltransferase [Thermoanaerobaculia bacterium]|nr:GNAT family N-acetyltransferase [Thermoanaerobaculia bacterium]